MYPTGILLDGYSVAIPHCDSNRANSPSIYIIRLPEPVQVDQADGDDKLWVKLIINLVVTDPANQLQLLKALLVIFKWKTFIKIYLSFLPRKRRHFYFHRHAIRVQEHNDD